MGFAAADEFQSGANIRFFGGEIITDFLDFIVGTHRQAAEEDVLAVFEVEGVYTGRCFSEGNIRKRDVNFFAFLIVSVSANDKVAVGLQRIGFRRDNVSGAVVIHEDAVQEIGEDVRKAIFSGLDALLVGLQRVTAGQKCL